MITDAACSSDLSADARPVTRLAIGAVIAALALTAVAGAAGAGAAPEAERSSAAAREVYLLPLGRFPPGDVATLARHFRRKLGVSLSVIPAAPLARAAFDRTRKQYVAEELFPTLRTHRTSRNSSAALIGLTTEDMYTRRTPTWRFAFGQRSEDGLAIVSSARMDPRLLGLNPDRALRMRRLQKMVMRNIGVLAFGFSLSQNPRSALYETILSGDDLDYMTEEFRPLALSRARRAWLGRANRVCERGIVEGKALIARSTIATSADLLAFARESIALEEQHQAELAAIAPAPEERSAVRTMLARFDRSIGADRAVVAKLSARWSDATLRGWVQDGIRFSLALKSNALELASRSCARYFDPATYG